jgi:DNA-binding NtrC family response regulator
MSNAAVILPFEPITSVRPLPTAFVRPTLRPTSRGKIIGHHPAMRAIIDTIERVASSSCTVLITGESGTGKELVVAALHDHSKRSEKPLVTVNCGAIPENLIESELFGHAKGAFTGAHASRQGFVAAAEGGTLFLDEVGELPLQVQVKLLRLLQQREYTMVGDSRVQKCDIRIVAATNRDLEAEVAQRRFREDLYYRLNVVPIFLPPLRERKEDIPALARFFLERYCEENRRDPPEIPAAILERLQQYDWPGNVRELENCCERAVVLSHNQPLQFDLMVPGHERRMRASHGKPADLDSLIQNLVRTALQKLPSDQGELYGRLVRGVERELLEQIMPMCDNVLVKAAARLGINRNTLHKKLSELKSPLVAGNVEEPMADKPRGEE